MQGDLFSWREPILGNGWIIWSRFLYFNFENLNDKSLCHSLGFNAFYMIQHHFMAFLKFFQIKEGGQNLSAERLNYLVPLHFFISFLKM